MLEDLLKVVYHIIVCCRGITHNKVDRLQLGNLGNGRFVYITIEASHKVVVIYKMNILSCNLLALNLGRKFYSEVKYHLEKQILIGAVSLYILYQAILS